MFEYAAFCDLCVGEEPVPCKDGSIDPFDEGRREVITTSRTLAVKLAELARDIRARINTVLSIETEKGPVTKLMKAFQETLVHDLDEDGFADMYAQTIAYGLLSARITDPRGSTADDFAGQIPITNPFLKELMETFLDVGGRKRRTGGGTGIDFDELGVSEVVELLDDANMEAVVRDFGDRNPQEDPVIHFYELFLKEYDAKKRMQRGVFYTPRPVVSFIVRSVDELLRTEFGLEDGLADTTTWHELSKRHKDLEIPEGVSPDQAFVQILDPATGTGTFLVEVIDTIYRTMKEKWEREAGGPLLADVQGQWNEYVPKYLLPRLHGYELLMAPYAIAHLKVGLKLYETGYRFGTNERARVYLTNALEPVYDSSGRFEFAIPALAHEAQAVNEIKQKHRFTVVTGNPPYSIISANSGEWIVALCETYKETVRTRERQIQALSDDYVKFVRLAQWQLERSASGVIGMITNNGYLDGHLFVDLRSSMLRACPSVRVLNLHGNLRTRERTPDGELDVNVFDIQTGVAVILARKPPHIGEPGVSYSDLWGDRESKYSRLIEVDRDTISWNRLDLADPSAPWIPIKRDVGHEWDSMMSLVEVFGTGDLSRDAQKRYAAGFVSQQDDFAIAFSRREICARVEALLDSHMTEERLRQRFKLCTTTQWSFDRARAELATEDIAELVTRCSYRPFDCRYTVFHRGVVSILRKELMRHLLRHKNIALLATRGISRQIFAHVFATSGPVDRHILDNASESMFAFPLFIYPGATLTDRVSALLTHQERVVNLAPRFLAEIYSAVPSGDPPSPEDSFQYIYSVLHSPAYRERYSEFLSIDFARIPLPGDSEVFRDMARLGGELVALHLMESPKLDNFITTPVGSGELQVEKVSYSDETVWVDKAKTRGFRGVLEEVWNFYIGGYQVCEKWLKDRQAKGGKKPRPGRVLTDEDIAHYQKIVVALNETIRIMKEIDEVIDEHGGWPDAFQVEGEREQSNDADG